MTTEAGVLFADIHGFTRLSEERDPEEVTALLLTLEGKAAPVVAYRIVV